MNDVHELIEALRRKASELEAICSARLTEAPGSIQDALAELVLLTGDTSESTTLKMEFQLKRGKLIVHYTAYVPSLKGSKGYQYSHTGDFSSLGALMADVRQRTAPDAPSETQANDAADLIAQASPLPGAKAPTPDDMPL